MKKMYKAPKDVKSLSQGYIPLSVLETMKEKNPKKAKRPKKKMLKKEDTPAYSALLDKYIKDSITKIK